MLGRGDIWESYPRYGPMEDFIEGFKSGGKYNTAFGPDPTK